MKVLVTGSCGLIGSETVRYFCTQEAQVVGLDNNMRRDFFGAEGDVTWMRDALVTNYEAYRHVDADIRDRQGLLELFMRERFDGVIHCAAQPSHDRAAKIPLTDFDVNAVGTINLLEANRQASPEAPFIFMSTNKVYGDGPNRLPLDEGEFRFEFSETEHQQGIGEEFPIDQTVHSVFGASKVAADVMVQEYGRYFGMPTCCLRGGCLTGPGHSAVALHGFLSFLVKCHVSRDPYTIIGYKGKQVRDNIHSADVVRFFDAFMANPKPGAVYNLGGGRANSVSILEGFRLLEKLTGQPANYSYTEANRTGDHICYYSDLSRMQADYPTWSITLGVEQVFSELLESWSERLQQH